MTSLEIYDIANFWLTKDHVDSAIDWVKLMAEDLERKVNNKNTNVPYLNPDIGVLENEILVALSKASCFTFSEIESVYLKVVSFDKTIAILKIAGTGIPLKHAVLKLLQNI